MDFTNKRKKMKYILKKSKNYLTVSLNQSTTMKLEVIEKQRTLDYIMIGTLVVDKKGCSPTLKGPGAAKEPWLSSFTHNERNSKSLHPSSFD